MATHYKGERITELLNIIATMEKRLDSLGITTPHAELAEAYTTITIAKAKLTSLQGGKEDECGK